MNREDKIVFPTKMHTDLDKTRDIGRILLERATEGPEFVKPDGLTDKEYAIWLTIVIALDYLKDADKLWKAARDTIKNPSTRYIFELDALCLVSEDILADCLHKCGLSIFRNRDARTLKTIADLLNTFYDGDPRNILEAGMYDGAQILELLDEFPYLRGKKLSLFWLRVMHDLVEPKLNIFGTSIPVDVHIAKITLRTGCIKYKDGYNGTIGKVTPAIQTCWDLTAMALGTYPSKFDEPLWSISKYICPICPDNCPIEQFCDKLDVHVTSQKVSVPKNE